jgi:biopolymer transport protein ExbB
MNTAWIVITVWLSRLVLLLLVVLSVYSISIILNRRRYFQALRTEELFLKFQSIKDPEELKSELNKPSSVYGQVFQAALGSQNPDQFEKRVSSAVLAQKADWEKGLPILGSLGSTTPFIGLLGTILGIIVAFGELSSGKMDSLKVMFALAEALILTAVGLGVAIPAVIANNYFGRKINLLMRSIESLRDRLMADLY